MPFDLPKNISLLKRLEPPTGRVRMVLDTDTYNEVDDQFALSYALASPEKLTVEAVYAAPFFNDRSSGPEDGMLKSYDEIKRLIAKMKSPATCPVFEGSRTYLPDELNAVDSPAARDLVTRAMNSTETLYVVAIGAITNVASALIMEPKIADKIVVVWLGGHPLYWRDTKEFNLVQDIPAARAVFNSGAPVVQIPCASVASHLLTTVEELSANIAGKSALCDALCELFGAYAPDHFAWAKEIWDISAIAWLISADWLPSDIEHSPVLTDQCTWSIDASRHFFRTVTGVNRNAIFGDMFKKMIQI